MKQWFSDMVNGHLRGVILERRGTMKRLCDFHSLLLGRVSRLQPTEGNPRGSCMSYQITELRG